MTSLPDRQYTVALIKEAQSNGARLVKACPLLNLSVRTYQRWISGSAVNVDQRPLALDLCLTTNSLQRSVKPC